MDGAAFDIAITNHDPSAFETAARAVGFLGFGFYPRSGFMHVDLGPTRQWGERAGRLAERLETREKANEVQRTMLEAAARRPRNRDELVDRLRDGGF